MCPGLITPGEASTARAIVEDVLPAHTAAARLLKRQEASAIRFLQR